VPGFENIGRPNHQHPDYRRFLNAVIYEENFRLVEETRPFIKNLSGHSNWVLSDESLSSTGASNSTIAARLRDIFGDAIILITIRNQISLIKSYYVSHGRHAKGTPYSHKVDYVSFDEWMSFFIGNPEWQQMRKFKYYETYRAYREFFSDVRVVPYELLANEKALYLSQLSDMFEVLASELDPGKVAPSNPGDTARLHRFLAFRRLIPFSNLRAFLPEKLKFALDSYLQGGKRADVNMTEEHVNFIGRIFGPGNDQLVKETDLDLQKWQYPSISKHN
jgi:hypothetical protein